MNKRIVFFLAVFLMVTMACSLTDTMNPTQPPDNSNVPEGQLPNDGANPTRKAPANPGKPTATMKPTVDPNNPKPVSISAGLASLNSYVMTYSIISKGPDPAASSTYLIETQRSQKQSARYTHITSTQTKKGASNPTPGDSEIYRIGNDQCTRSSDKWSWNSMAPNQAEMMDVLMNLMEFTPVVDKATFVGKETINGIPSKHFSFKITGLGVKSGAEVTANQGDYWLAVDGQYIVRYSLVLETVVDPETNVMHMETLIDLKQINQPVNIAFPQACMDAKLATPTP
jgi:hypothetical protein